MDIVAFLLKSAWTRTPGVSCVNASLASGDASSEQMPLHWIRWASRYMAAWMPHVDFRVSAMDIRAAFSMIAQSIACAAGDW